MYRINLYYQNLNCEDEGDEDVRDNGKKERKILHRILRKMNSWNARCFLFK